MSDKLHIVTVKLRESETGRTYTIDHDECTLTVTETHATVNFVGGKFAYPLEMVVEATEFIQDTSNQIVHSYRI